MVPKQKIIFMGTPVFSVPVLRALVTAGYEVVAAYSQPPKPAGRGHQIQKSPVHLTAEEFHIPVYTPLNFKDSQALEQFQALVRDNAVDLAVVVAYGLLLPKGVLEAPAQGCVNVHASLLPRWRGAAPIARAIEAGDQETGITIMQMNEGLDTGPMLSNATTVIGPQETGQTLHDRLSQMGADLLMETLPEPLVPVVQPLEGVTYAKKLNKIEAALDWEKDARILERQVRAFNPWPLCHMSVAGIPLKVFEAIHMSDMTGPVGSIIDKNFTVTCGQGALRLLRVQPAGKKPMGGADFLRGLNVLPDQVEV